MISNLSELNNALHAQMQRLANADEESLKAEIERSRAFSGIAKNLIDVAGMAMEHEKLLCTVPGYTAPEMLTLGEAGEQ